MTETEFHRAVLTLGDAGYLNWEVTEMEGGGGCFFQGLFVTGRGKQALGLWPLFDVLGSPTALAGLLDDVAHDAATEEERSNYHRAAAVVRQTAPELARALVFGALRTWSQAHLGL